MTFFLMKTKVREYIKRFDPKRNVSENFFDGLELEMMRLIKVAIRRADNNGRNTVMGKDV